MTAPMEQDAAFASCDRCLGAVPTVGPWVVFQPDGGVNVYCDEACAVTDPEVTA